MKRNIAIVSSLVIAIAFVPTGNDINVNVQFKHHLNVPSKATMEQKKANKIMAMKFAKAGFSWDYLQRRCIYKLFMAESRFDNYAKNQRGSSAFGIAQMLNETSKEPEIQILNAYRYIKHRYDTPCKAWAHHSKGWY